MENFLNRKDNLTNGNPGFFSQQFIQAELIMLEVLCMHVGESCPYIIHLCHSTWTQSSKYKGSTYWLVIGDIHLVNSTFWWLAMLKSNPTVWHQNWSDDKKHTNLLPTVGHNWHSYGWCQPNQMYHLWFQGVDLMFGGEWGKIQIVMEFQEQNESSF